ncbi:hypothetical protein SELMODRAFT_93539 [Selaginella moellendorffii]|uniref:Uncharacterized protein n=2 Tax=Selaginella moellendorffii TaxID=88036 RepID=D8RGZ2_SELML|nr:hypothetical protein SELMODRAFT_93539 [Selaginella moellendorffii]
MPHRPAFTASYCFLEPICATLPSNPDPSLASQDLAPVCKEGRLLSSWDMTFLWLGLVVGVPNYYLAGSLVELGMAWWQGIGTVLLANVITYCILVLAAHPGTKYGISFPVLLRASFGVFGANVPALLRGFVACGWYGIETWIGGEAIFRIVDVMLGKNRFSNLAESLPLLGTSVPELGCFFLFWLLQLWIVWNGIESIKKLEKYSAPVLIVLTVALLVWAVVSAGGFGAMLAASSAFGRGGRKEGKFWQVFLPSLTANIGTWSTLSLNIPDFSRYTYSQADQILGQASLPLFMAAFSFVGLAVTSASEVIFGHAISNPIELLSRIRGGFLVAVVSLIGVTLATLTTNIAANVVAPANALVNLDPKRFTYRSSGLVVAVISVCFLPWKLLQTSESFIYAWLVGYSALLGPIGGILLADYYILRQRKLDIDSLYSSSNTGKYWYSKGVNPAAMVALTAGILPCIPGFLSTVGLLKLKIPRLLLALYDGAWFVGFFVAGLVYLTLSCFPRVERAL